MIGVDFATYTSLTTGITQQTLNAGAAVIVPSNARQIKAVQPFTVPVTPTAGQSVMSVLILDSDDLPLKPAQFGVPVSQAILGATGSMYVPPSPIYNLNMPCAGGERITVAGRALVANTVAPLMGCAVYYDTDLPVLPILHGKLGTLTSTGVAATEVPDTTPMTVNGGTVLEFGYGIVGATVQLASIPYLGRGRIQSSDLSPPFPSTFPIQPIGPLLSTLGCPASAGIAFADLALALKQNATLNLSHLLDRALAGSDNCNFAIGIIYS